MMSALSVVITNFNSAKEIITSSMFEIIVPRDDAQVIASESLVNQMESIYTNLVKGDRKFA